MTVEELHAALAKQIEQGRGWYRVEIDGDYGEVSEARPIANGVLLLDAE